MKDVTFALDQLNTTVFTSADEVFEVLEELEEEGMIWTMDEETSRFQVTDLVPFDRRR